MSFSYKIHINITIPVQSRVDYCAWQLITLGGGHPNLSELKIEDPAAYNL